MLNGYVWNTYLVFAKKKKKKRTFSIVQSCSIANLVWFSQDFGVYAARNQIGWEKKSWNGELERILHSNMKEK